MQDSVTPNCPSTRIPFSWDDFGNVMQSFQKQMFRLETRTRYQVSWDDQMLPEYLAGKEKPEREDPRWQAWFSDLRRLVDSGRDIVRVRLVRRTIEKGSYLDYEIRWSYLLYNIPNGERVLMLRSDGNSEGTHVLNEDFFIFDDAFVFIVNYNADDSLRGLERETDPRAITCMVALKDALLRKATPLQQYIE